MIDRLQRIMDHSKNFKEDRPVMSQHNSDPMRLLDLLKTEILEAQEELLQVTNYQNFAGESADPETLKRMRYVAGQELADIAWFTVGLFQSLDLDMYEHMMTKAARNHLKHPAFLYQEGSYKDAVSRAREQWTPLDQKDFDRGE